MTTDIKAIRELVEKHEGFIEGPWFAGAQNDILYIINKPPRPSLDDKADIPDVEVIAKVYGLGADPKAELLADSPALFSALRTLLKRVEGLEAGEGRMRALLERHHAHHLLPGTIGLPDGKGGWIEIDNAAEYCDSQLYEDTQAALSAPPAEPQPINVILHCPSCHEQHIDAPSEGWSNPPHKSHLCHACGTIWRPADVPTNGVAEIRTRGKDDDTLPAPPHASEQQDSVLQQAADELDEAMADRRAKIAATPANERGGTVRIKLPDSDGWIPWSEGWIPDIPRDAITQLKVTSQGREWITRKFPAGAFDWTGRGDDLPLILAYRIVPASEGDQS